MHLIDNYWGKLLLNIKKYSLAENILLWILIMCNIMNITIIIIIMYIIIIIIIMYIIIIISIMYIIIIISIMFMIIIMIILYMIINYFFGTLRRQIKVHYFLICFICIHNTVNYQKYPDFFPVIKRGIVPIFTERK